MSELLENHKLRSAMRALAKHRDWEHRKALYFALLESHVWTAVQQDTEVEPDALPSADALFAVDTLQNRPVYAIYTNEAQSQKGDDPPRAIRVPMARHLGVLLSTNAASLRIDPHGKVGGELYRHELEMVAEGARRMAIRDAAAEVLAEQADDEAHAEIHGTNEQQTLLQKIGSWFAFGSNKTPEA